MRDLERGQTGSDSVIRAWLNLDPVGWIGVDQMNRGAIEQAVHVLRFTRVTTQETVPAHYPQIARSCDRLIGRSRHLVRIAESLGDARVEQAGQLFLVEAEQAEVVVHGLQLGQLDRQKFVIPIRKRGRLIIGEAIGFGLGRRQPDGDVDRHLLQSKLQRGLVAGVADEDDAVLVHHDRLAETVGADGRRHGIDGGVVVTRIVPVRSDAGEGA
jgi:hypothetical protein